MATVSGVEDPPLREAAVSGEPLDRRSLGSVGRGTAIMVLGTGFLFLFTLVSRVAIARGYSGTEWGEFSLGVALTGLLSVVTLMGLDQATARMLSFEREPAVRRAILVKGVGLSVTSGALASLALFLLAVPLASLFHAPGFAPVVELLSVALGFSVAGLMLAAVFQGLEDAFPNALFNQILTPGLFVLSVVVAVLFRWNFLAVIVGYTASSGAALAGFAVYAVRRLPKLVPTVSGPAPPVPQLWHFAAALWGVGALYYVTAFFDTLVLGLFRPLLAVGLYSAGINLARVLLIGNNALTFIYLPVAARLARDRKIESMRSTYLAGTRWINLLTTPVMLLFCFLPAASLTAVYGPGFGAGAPALAILAAASFASIVVGPANATLAGLGETRWLLLSTLVSAGINTGLSLTLIPTYGLMGAAAAWGIARVAYPAVACYRIYTRYQISAFQPTLLKPLAFALGVGVPLFALLAIHGVPPWAVFPLFGVGILIYAVGLVVTKSLVPGDIVAAKAIESTLGWRLPRLVRAFERLVSGPSAELPDPH